MAKILLAAAVLTIQVFARAQPPNVVLILADDLGYGDTGCYGATKVRTPNIDRLASEGRRFTDAHSASAVCTPSRYALLTGEYPFRKDIWGPAPFRSPLLIDPAKTTMASLLRRQGYASACFGKWHLGFGAQPKPDWNADLKPGPLELGFDHFFGIPVVNSSPPHVWVEDHRVVGLDPKDPIVYGGVEATQAFPAKNTDGLSGGKAAHALYKDEELGTTLTAKATAWMRGQTNKPFFLYFATPHIHHLFTPGARFKGSSQAGLYGDFIQEFDWMVGEILRTLDELKLRENTLVILTSDNGGMLNVGGQDAWRAGHRLNGNLLGFKFDAWEGGHRVPYIARWPGKIEAGTTSNQLICHVDLLATVAALTGGTLRAGDAPDSFNVLPALTGSPDKPIRDHVVLAPNKKQNLAMRQGRWMYIGAQGGGGFTGTKPGDHLLGGPAALTFAGEVNSDVADGRLKPDAPTAQLYDLTSDPWQTRNVIREHPEVAARLKVLLGECQNSPRTAPTGWSPIDGGEPYPSRFTFQVAIGHEPGVSRRDPSDVLRVGGTYFVWYSKVKKGPGVWGYPSGYSADVWYATSTDGRQWLEQGEAVGKGGVGTWDEHGVFTPDILAYGGQYFLYYTAVAAGHSSTTPTHIGVAVAASPAGPWRKFEKNPVLSPSPDPTQFDSMRVDDAALLVRNDKVWLYYKGRQQNKTPGETKMGLAIAEAPIGPFTKHGRPLHPGHEVMVWPQGKGVASLATAAGPRQVYFSADGLSFEPRNVVSQPPAAPGAWRSDSFRNDPDGQGLVWGISHATAGGDLFLQRFDCVR
jgi:arylsulfatase A-like enzyme